MFQFALFSIFRFLGTTVHLTPSFTHFFNFIKSKRQLSESLNNGESIGNSLSSCYSRPFIAIKALLYAYLGVGLFRTTYLAFLIAHSPDKKLIHEHLHFDPILCFYILKLNTFGDPLAVIAISLLPIYCISVDFIMTVRFLLMPMEVFETVHSFLVYDTLPFKQGSFTGRTQKVRRIANQLVKSQKLSLDGNHLTNVIYFDQATVKRVAILYPLINLVGISSHVVFVTFFLVSSTLVLCELYRFLPWYIFLYSVLDQMLINYISWNALRISLFAYQLLFVVFSATAIQVKALKRSLSILLAQEMLFKCVFKRPRMTMFTSLSIYQLHHFKLMHFALLANRILISPIMFVAFLGNLLINVMLVALLFTISLSTRELVFFFIILSFQLVIIGSSSLLCILFAKSLYSSAPLILKALSIASCAEVNGSTGLLRYRLKTMTFYEGLHRKRKFTFTIGSVARITSRTAYQFCYAYSAFAMYVFTFVKHARSHG